MQDNYTSFKIHSNYYAGILDVIEDLPDAEKNSILAEYFLAFHEYGNTRKIPEFKNKIAQGFFKTHLYSIDKSFADNDEYCASHEVGSYGGKQKAINAKIRAAEKKYQETEKKLEEIEAKQAELEAKAKQAEQDSINLKEVQDQKQPKNSLENDKSLDNKGISPGSIKRQQLQKKHQLDWNCVEGLELTEQQQQEAIRIRKANNTGKVAKFTQASLKMFLSQVKQSVDAGVSVDEVLEVWEGKQWRSWTHAYYAKDIANDLKAQSQTAKNLKSAQWAQESSKDNNWDNLEITPLVKDLVQSSIDEKIKQSKKGGN